MSRINGEKARANVAKRRRTAMRLKSREARAAATTPAASAKPKKSSGAPRS